MKILNKRASFEYNLFEKFEAGIALTGVEVASIKAGRADINHAYVRIRDGEAWLINANIPAYEHSTPVGYEPTRSRKVLLHKAELISLSTKISQEKLTIVPISLYNKGRLVKAQLSLGKGKRQFEKRESKRKKDIDRDTERALKER